MKHSVSFDIDGTLLNTEKMNREAYWRFGVEVPDYAIGLRWQTWLPNITGSMAKAEEIHSKKVLYYADKLRTVDLKSYVLSPTYLAREFIRRPDIHVQFLTAGSVTTANIILQRLALRASMAGNLSYEARRLALHSSVLGSDGIVVYIDDHEENVTRLRDDVPGLSVIHYVGHSSAELRTTVQEMINVRS